ncbi:hypothetical protein FJT64_002123 [Amphibalanus amphitrite]|uniref:Uncharacterized protein n=1 Tax=Amphibalanus amphitrite TaxID=1232801 RepID=A0A6A4X1V7_AMPAM|nr:hypothetical protein FJT64_002123 [Amphibalanus amphitrite]
MAAKSHRPMSHDPVPYSGAVPIPRRRSPATMSRRASLFARQNPGRRRVRFPDEVVFDESVKENDADAVVSMLRRASVDIDVNRINSAAASFGIGPACGVREELPAPQTRGPRLSAYTTHGPRAKARRPDPHSSLTRGFGE